MTALQLHVFGQFLASKLWSTVKPEEHSPIGRSKKLPHHASLHLPWREHACGHGAVRA